MSLSQSQIEFARNVKAEDVPVKLRCAICSNLAINAFRLPCCDQAICESCHSDLPDSCPVCAHSPITAAACTPHKSLRATVRAWIKGQEKKKENKDRATGIPAQPKTPLEAPSEFAAVVPSVEQPSVVAGSKPDSAEQPDAEAAPREQEANAPAAEQAPDVAQFDSKESAQSESSDIHIQTGDTSEQPHPQNGNEEKHAQEGAQEAQEPQVGAKQGETAGWNMNEGQQMFNNGYGFDPSQAGFSGMDWNSNGFNPMMQMPMNGNWNGFPNMMGLPGMGMNPMNMQNGMLGNFGGMGTNGMNMGMGMNTGGGFGGWNGQMGNDFASGGFYPNGGYDQSHQGHYSQQMHYQQQYPKNNFQNRNRSQGQNAYAQKGFGHGANGSFGAQNQNYGSNQGFAQAQSSGQSQAQNGDVDDAFAHQLPPNLRSRRSSQHGSIGQARSQRGTTEPAEGPEKAHSNTGDAQAQIDTKHNADADKDVKADVNEQDSSEALAQLVGAREASGPDGLNPTSDSQVLTGIPPVDMQDMSIDVDQQQMMTNASLDPNMQQQMQYDMAPRHSGYPDYPSRGRGARGGFGRGGYNDFRGGFAGRGGRGYNAYGPAAGLPGDVTVVTPQEPRGVGVEGAPTGPKAMREGHNPRGRGGFPQAPARGANAMPVASANSIPDRSKAGSQEPRRSPSPANMSRSRSRSRSPSRKHRESHRHRDRSRSAGTSSETESRERRHEHRRHRSRKDKYEDEDYDMVDRDDEYGSRDKERENRPRDDSRESKYRSSRRDKDKHRSSRSHRDRSREHRRHKYEAEDSQAVTGAENASRRKSKNDKHKDRDYDRNEDRDREKDRDRERERDRKKSSRRDRDRSATAEDDRDYKSSRRTSRKEKDDRRDRDHDRAREKDTEREKDREQDRSGTSALPTPSETEFKIQGRSKTRNKINILPITSMQPPTGPKGSTRVPTGPAVQRRPSISSQHSADIPPSRRKSATPSAPPVKEPEEDPYKAAREDAERKRQAKEDRRKSLLGGLGGKRSFSDLNDEDSKRSLQPPTGPSADRRNKRHRSDRPSRRISIKYEGEENDLRRAETEREAGRWR